MKDKILENENKEAFYEGVHDEYEGVHHQYEGVHEQYRGVHEAYDGVHQRYDGGTAEEKSGDTEPTVAPGMRDFVEESASVEEVKEGDFTEVTRLSFDETH